MINFINNLNSDSLISLARIYCNIIFTKEEIEPIMPFLKNIYFDYYSNPEKRKNYQDQLKNMTSEETYNKIYSILNKFNLT